MHLIEVDLTVRADTPFTEYVGFTLTGLDPHAELATDRDGLFSGEREIRMRRLVMTAEPQPTCTLRVGGLLVFPSP